MYSLPKFSQFNIQLSIPVSYRAVKGFVASVSPHVSSQLLLGEEGFGAAAALVISKLKMKTKYLK